MNDSRLAACGWRDLYPRGDARGSLIAIEAMRDVPFAIERTYYIFGTSPGVARGFHAHKDLQQLAVSVSGSCRMVLDDGSERRDFLLNSPAKALYIGPMIWREMYDFSEDCVLLVLASKLYDETDYIRDHDEFRSLIRLTQ
jgi:dTDP-4-dehydrorhamnose 3,5-epimerase-like enzyme